MIKISKKLIEDTIEKSKCSVRKRSVNVFHESNDDLIQRFINAIEPESVVEPHKHENSFEVFIALKGKIELIVYDDKKNIIDKVIISPNSNLVGVEVEKGKWHSLKAIEEGSVVYIIMQGPYKKKTHRTIIK